MTPDALRAAKSRALRRAGKRIYRVPIQAIPALDLLLKQRLLSEDQALDDAAVGEALGCYFDRVISLDRNK